MDSLADALSAAVLGERGVLRALLRAAVRPRASCLLPVPCFALPSRLCLVLRLPRCSIPFSTIIRSSINLSRAHHSFINEDVKDIKVVVNYDM
jgi:hypothetical protein